MNTKKLGLALAAAGASSLSMAQAVSDPVAVVNGLVGTTSGYAAPMFALAVAAVGILIGVKWIKRARGAA